MARKSRKIQAEPQEIVQPSQIFPTAIYARLSVENSGKDDDGAALQNQIDVCREYIKTCPYLSLQSVYSDNGKTGTVFDRPAFNRLMDDIRSGSIKCLVVRDLSRFGRDYIEAGTYLERIFPKLDVRFISVKEQFDTFATDGSNESLMIPLQNLINDLYSKDISRKVSTALRIQMENGSFRWRKLPYGFCWNEERTQIIPDEATAPFVRDIFKWKLEGASLSTMLTLLDDAGAPIPETLQRTKGNMDGVNTVCWSRSSVFEILRNPAYAGDKAVGRSKQSVYAGMKEVQVKDRAQWYVAEDAHERLVSREDFDAVQHMMKQASEERKQKMEASRAMRKSLVDLFDGKVFCADCGKRMYFHRHKIDKDKRGRWYAAYECSTYVGRRAAHCTAHRIRQDLLNEKVLGALQLQIQTALDYEQVIEGLRDNEADKKLRAKMNYAINSVNLKLRGVGGKRTRLYEDFADGILNEEEYQFAKSAYDEQWETLNRQLDELIQKRNSYTETLSSDNKWISLLKGLQEISILTKELADMAIDHIVIYEDGSIELFMKYHDVFVLTGEYLQEICGEESA